MELVRDAFEHSGGVTIFKIRLAALKDAARHDVVEIFLIDADPDCFVCSDHLAVTCDFSPVVVHKLKLGL